ncbi:MAG: ATP-binding protein [Candidatus Omnitrophota bacterium]
MIKEKFFGREDYLELINKRVSGLKDHYRQNIALIGDETVGKTTLIFQLLSKFCDNQIITIYLEIRPVSIEYFAKRFIGVLLYNFLINSGEALKEDLEFLLNKSQKYIPQTIEKAKIILKTNKRKKANIFTGLLSLCETLYQETGKFCVVILDEFQNLESLGVKDLYREWSKLLLTQKNTMYILTSSLKFKAKSIFAKDLSLLFGNFEQIEVGPFDIKTSEKYLDSQLNNLKLKLGLKEFLVHFTGGYPLYLKIISEELSKSKEHNLSEMLENLLFYDSGILNQRFSNYIKRFFDSPYSNDYISILYLISSGRNKIRDISHILKKQKKDLNARINHLLELDTITRNGDFLKINDRVFSFWLRFVYQEKLQSLTFDASNQKIKFKDRIQTLINEFYRASQKSLSERMTELLRLFENETVQLENKRIRLNHFREIKRLEFRGRNLKNGILGRSHDNLWIIAITQGLLTEHDILDFSKECRKYRQKPQRKIMVTLRDIETNTRLRALEEKVITWNIDDLNQMFDLFAKPRLVR